MLEQEETFIRCLTKKMLTYAIGRKLNSGDRLVVDGMVEEMNNSSGGLRDLVKQVALSKAFRQN